MPQELDRLLEEVQNLHYEVSTESRLVRVGLKEAQNVEAIISRFPRVTDFETVRGLKDRLGRPGSPEEKEPLARLYFHCLGFALHKALAKLDDEVTSFLSKAVVTVDGEEIPYHNLYTLLSNEGDFDRRERLGAGYVTVHAEVNPNLETMLAAQVELLRRECGYESIIRYCREKKNLAYGAIAEALSYSLERTDGIYEPAMEAFVNGVLGKSFRGLWRVHVPYLLRLRGFDGYFPKESLFARANASLKKMGLDFGDYPNIRLDLEDRPRKNSRACCFSSRVPDEIHLILKPMGGLRDYETFLHEGGHALHYGSTDRALPYAYRELSRSHALTETYAFLLQNLTMNAAWLEQEMNVPADHAVKIRRERILVDLFMYRRYIGKFLAELAFFRKGDLGDSSFYERLLAEATGFMYEPSGYLTDMDGEFYSCDYLRAWVHEAELEHCLRTRFGEAWFLQEEAGRFLKELWRAGDREDPEEVLARLGYAPFDVSYLEKRFEELR